MHSEDGGVRGLAVWALGRLQDEMAREALPPLATDTTLVRLYEQGRVRVASVAELVQEALARLTVPDGA